MREAHFNEIKNAKSFYVRTYRRGLSWLVVSLFLNALLMLAIFYTYFNQPERDYYATNGVTAPVSLNPMSQANKSPNALLEPDPDITEQEKAIPR